jgi:hypothetical protein
MGDDWQTGDQSVEQAMQYLQEVEQELPEKDLADFLNITEDFKTNRSFAPPCRCQLMFFFAIFSCSPPPSAPALL